MSTVSFRLPEDLDRQLSEEAVRSHKKRSEVVREAIAEFISRRERERFMQALVEEARAGYASQRVSDEAKAISGDFDAAEHGTREGDYEKWWE